MCHQLGNPSTPVHSLRPLWVPISSSVSHAVGRGCGKKGVFMEACGCILAKLGLLYPCFLKSFPGLRWPLARGSCQGIVEFWRVVPPHHPSAFHLLITRAVLAPATQSASGGLNQTGGSRH